ncbi:MAG: radical SAM protein [Deltaproteobacteria bacterium]|nr:radical SAM protein [Deltaproteobacteria bacterium]MBW1953140.1 radical SAM protein [Deltaproteobacteria bacterium]MBW1987019.1 radical SAM protein [Deltaproteobacteria bacterium]
MEYIFGPVPSRRLGLSLGVDLVPLKTCTFDCIYCELGRTVHKTMERREYHPAAVIIQELQSYFKQAEILPDYVTLAGSGEPTLNVGLGEIIKAVKRITRVPVAVLTNGSLFFLPEVREDLLQADLVLPSLDSASPGIYRAINRPVAGLELEQIIAGQEAFRKAFQGQIWLEILLLRGINDDQAELEKLRHVIARLRPERVQLNTAVRPVVEDYAVPLSPEQLRAAAAFLGEGVEVIAEFDPATHAKLALSDADFLETLARRPMTAQNLAEILALPLPEVLKRLNQLKNRGLISYSVHHHQGFYFYPRSRVAQPSSK